MDTIILGTVVGIIIIHYILLYKHRNDPIQPIKPKEDWLQPPLNHITWEDKQEYLHSEEWRKLRWSILTRDKFTCICGSKIGLEVHHITYDRWRHEQPEDLIILCRTCHQRRHNNTGYSYNTEH